MLSVVIPTRNRPAQVKRLLHELARQSLPPAQFEVVVVDDGSDPPLAMPEEQPSFKLVLLRREADHGAHASRCSGLRAAQGERVLFLDDDVALEPRVLEMHSACDPAGRIGLGPIRYPQTGVRTPFVRYMARNFDLGNERCLANLFAGEYWVCNSSAPGALFAQAFDRLAQRYRGPLLGGAHDETMLREMFRELHACPLALHDAVTWHLDDKTLAACCSEWQLTQEHVAASVRAGWFAGRQGEMCGNRSANDVRRRAREWVMRWHWRYPGPLLALAAALRWIADEAPPRLVPAIVCRIPLMVAFWEGWRSGFPDHREFAVLVNDTPAFPGHVDDTEG